MRGILRAGLILFLSLLTGQLQAQLNPLFAPYDCRKHMEISSEETYVENIVIDESDYRARRNYL